MSLRILAVLLLFTASTRIFAANTRDEAEGESDLIDATTDVEELTADSEAAIAQAKAAKIRIAKETAENQRKLKGLMKARDVAKDKRMVAREALKKDEAVIAQLMTEQGRLKKDLQKSESDIAAAEKAMLESRALTAKKKAETLALQNLQNEKQAQLAETNQKREKAIQEGIAADQEQAQAQQQFKKASEDEVGARKAYDTTVVEEAKHKLRVEEQIAALKLRYQTAKDNIAKLEKEASALREKNSRLEAQAAAGLAEVEKVEQRQEELKPKAPLAASR